MSLDWHAAPLSRETKVTPSYKNTQNVRRFLRQECGADFKFNRPFMQWIKDGDNLTLGDVADEWTRQHTAKTAP